MSGDDLLHLWFGAVVRGREDVLLTILWVWFVDSRSRYIWHRAAGESVVVIAILPLLAVLALVKKFYRVVTLLRRESVKTTCNVCRTKCFITPRLAIFCGMCSLTNTSSFEQPMLSCRSGTLKLLLCNAH